MRQYHWPFAPEFKSKNKLLILGYVNLIKFTDFRLSLWFTADVDSALKSLHREAVGSNDVPEVNATRVVPG